MSNQTHRSNPTQRKVAAGLVSLVLFGATQLSHAESTFTLNTSGAWTSYIANDSSVGAVVNGVNTAELSWGDTPETTDPQSSLLFTPTSYAGGFGLPLGVAFKLGTLTHSNQVIDIATGISDANLRLNLTFGPSSGSTEFNYNFNIFESPNTSGYPAVQLPLSACAPWQASETPCDDRISFTDKPTSQQFSFNGMLYSFTLLGFSNGEGYSSEMITTENTNTTQFLMANITAVPVPVPAALWLFGSGLLGLAGFAKRKRTHQ
jgi:hypothetical protein